MISLRDVLFALVILMIVLLLLRAPLALIWGAFLVIAIIGLIYLAGTPR